MCREHFTPQAESGRGGQRLGKSSQWAGRRAECRSQTRWRKRFRRQYVPQKLLKSGQKLTLGFGRPSHP